MMDERSMDTSLGSTAGNPTPFVIHVVAHTHWDREWYHQSERFRQRLVALIDARLATSASTVNAPFLLDGQAIVLEDYLRVRPDAAPELTRLMQQRAIEAGPWYVLGDNLIPSGEALVRNLEAGERLLTRLGASAPPVAYCPDTFGHPAMMPMIARGFGFAVAVLWRGAGGSTHPQEDTWSWEAPDGSRVLAYHLPPDGYEFGSVLPTGAEAAQERWSRLLPIVQTRNRVGVALLLNGADHHALQPDVDEALAAAGVLLRHLAPRVELQRSSLASFASALSAAAPVQSATIVRGELRNSYGYCWTLGGTLATRAHQKRRNAQLERALLRDVEPWIALARLHGTTSRDQPRADAQITMAQLPVLLHAAWTDLLTTHPHDTLCGCSVDAVSRAMEMRQESVATQVDGLRTAALQVALRFDGVRARNHHPTHGAVVLRNRTSRAREGLALLRLATTIGEVRVGPDSGDASRSGDAAPLALDLSALPPDTVVQLLGSTLVHARRESPQHYPDNDLVRVHRVLAWVPEVPAFGVRVLSSQWHTAASGVPPDRVTVTEDALGIHLRNTRLQLTVDRRTGELSLHQGDRIIRDAVHVESCTDYGDSYTPSPRGSPQRLRCRQVRLRERGPLRGSIRIDLVLDAEPAESDADERPRGRVRLSLTVSLDAGSEVIRCTVRGYNRRRDHRLRLLWRTDVTAPRVLADAAFGPIDRDDAASMSTAAEQVVRAMPLHRWVSVHNETSGATVISDGLAEAEVNGGTVAVTLVRAIGQLSRADLHERPGHAGWPAAIPDAQCLAPFSAGVALLLHGAMSNITLTRIRDAADDVLLPLVGETWRDFHDGVGDEQMRVTPGPALVSDAMEGSTVTLTRDARAVILRAVNLTSEQIEARWELPVGGPWLATRCQLDETALTPPARIDTALVFMAQPREVVTFRLERLSLL